MDEIDKRAIAYMRDRDPYLHEDTDEELYKAYNGTLCYAIIRVRMAWRAFMAELIRDGKTK